MLSLEKCETILSKKTNRIYSQEELKSLRQLMYTLGELEFELYQLHVLNKDHERKTSEK